MDDAALLHRARQGEEDAFVELYSRHQRAICRYAAYMCGADACDDIVQDTFLALLRQKGRRDAVRGSAGSYLLGIARHLALKRWSAANDTELSAFDDETIAEAAAVDQTSALDDLARGQTVAAVRAAVHSLPSAYREAIVLCDLQEMDYASASAVIGCPIGTLRSRLNRARALLTSKLARLRDGARDARS